MRAGVRRLERAASVCRGTRVRLVLETIFHASRSTKKRACRKARRGMAHSEFKSREERRVSQGSCSVTCRFGHALGTLRQETPLLMTRSLPWPPCQPWRSCPRQHRFLILGLVRTAREVSNQTLSDNANSISRSSPERHARSALCVCAPAPLRLRGCSRRHVLITSPLPALHLFQHGHSSSSIPG